MGFKQPDIVPLNGAFAGTPPGKRPDIKVIQVSRTDSGALTKAVIPASGSVTLIHINGSVASDATTSASVAVNLIRDGVTFSTGSVDVKTNGTITAIVQMTNLPNVQPVPQGGEVIVSTTKTTSGAETVGGPWKFTITYVA